ncbi:NADH dehydrogenase [ubiquinone] 1 beta subcomplex subunit 11, mitochondrial-like [Saccoglossus kowalevskii]|uniref:NADH dehydrogenase [ubiquinone] 1 beta subcomplex subunit 11, mitochondrial n=1 Tax=Saccoglossus kowalevskii TaxID=10224 RepID=A0ABM0GXI7_SACKO|nr:PREDICTED: NADH dehydrogenase [ubiquinone] 1 beta subcomplex subunit 11, mitochondrial-like [Saccoglossus kowalevskii]
MASLMRVARFGRILAPAIARSARLPRPTTYQPIVFSSTSESKKSEFVVGKQTEVDPKRVEEIIREGEREVRDDVNDPGYVGHGFSNDPFMDSLTAKLTFFCSISIFLVFVTLFAHYMPDTTGRVWSAREAERVVAEREAMGQPLINPNFVDPDRISLPDDDE